jgi:hypothetical protein
MRVFEGKICLSLVSLGDEIQLNRADRIADHLRSAFDEHPMQEAFYCVYLDRKNHPPGRHLITLGGNGGLNTRFCARSVLRRDPRECIRPSGRA